MTGIVFYTNKLVGDGFTGCTRGPFIFIRPEYKSDAGLLAHEQTHVKQWLRTLGLHGILYSVSKRYRLASEVEAYKRQLEFYERDLTDKFAEFVATKYELEISKEAATMALKGTK